MKFSSFLKEKMKYIALTIFFCITSEILLLPYDIHIFIRLYIAIMPIIICIINIIYGYFHKKSFYDKLENNLEKLNQKYLISEIIDTPDFIEGKILKETIEEAGKSMIENVNKYKYNIQDYKDYIELWIHEIKTPIAASKMIIENNKNDVTKSIDEELDEIQDYVEQALYYARSNTVEKDYCIKKNNLKEIVNSSIIKNKRLILQNKVSLDIQDNDIEIYTDEKWTMFIIDQLIQNSIKYSKPENKKLEISSVQNKENVILKIKDNGIGIKEADISKVFDKGFTGYNGRLSGKKSTGIGLYLCKKLCDKLGLSITIDSKYEEYTEIKITFPKNSFTIIK